MYVCGNTTTTSGLTVTLSKDSSSGDFALEAGALVLGDQGKRPKQIIIILGLFKRELIFEHSLYQKQFIYTDEMSSLVTTTKFYPSRKLSE